MTMIRPLSLYCLLFGLFAPLALSAQYQKTFIQPDKSIYAAGEDLFAAIYLVDARTLRPDTNASLIHVELHAPGGEVVARRKVLAPRGHAAADLVLGKDLAPGVYQLTAYTPAELATSDAKGLYRKAIRIIPGLDLEGKQPSLLPPATETATDPVAERATTQLRFFPEGGLCVTGLPCRVAVVAETQSGRPVITQGFVKTAGDESMSFFQTGENGIASFTYVPRPDAETRAFLEVDAPGIALPPAAAEGTNVRVSERRDTFYLQIQTNYPNGFLGMRAELRLRGQPVTLPPLPRGKRGAVYPIPTADLLPGVYTLTVFNERDWPDAERLFFVSPNTPSLEVALATQQPGTRDRATINFKLPPAAVIGGARLSYGVTSVAANGGPTGDDIRTWLLLNSELDRPVPNAPELLFATDPRLRDVKIDEYLLTREWRRFVPIPTDSLQKMNGLYLRGRMTKYENKEQGRTGKVWLSNLKNAFSETTLTDEEGYFAFGPFLLFDTIDVQLQGRFRMGKRNFNDKIDLDANNFINLETFGHTPPTLPEVKLPQPPLEALEAYAELSRRSLTIARNYDSLIIDLDVIDVVTKRIDKVEEARNERTRLYGQPDNRIVVDESPGGLNALSVADLLQGIAGVRVTGFGQDVSVQIRGLSTINASTEPLYVLDGFQTTADVIFSLPVQQVEFIDILKGPSAAVYGVNGSNGVILVYTRSGLGFVRDEPGLLNTQLYGYHAARQFAVFDDSGANSKREDFRTTLHWNPVLLMSADGRASDSFRTSDQTGEFIITVQGLSQGGQPIFGTGSFRVK